MAPEQCARLVLQHRPHLAKTVSPSMQQIVHQVIDSGSQPSISESQPYCLPATAVNRPAGDFPPPLDSSNFRVLGYQASNRDRFIWGDQVRLTGYRLESYANARPASGRRSWMDSWPKKHPYRCWPLTVTNGYGWEMVCGSAFAVTWNGGPSSHDIKIISSPNARDPIARSHFGGGTITFFPGCFFRTEEPYHLFVTGPLNQPKRGLSPLSAIVETSWLPYRFAMTFVITEPNLEIRFEEGEPFCQFFPLDSRAAERIEPEWRDLSSDPVLWRQFHEWFLQRRIVAGDVPGLDLKRSFETRYQRGILPDGAVIADQPPKRYCIADFVDRSTGNCSLEPDGEPDRRAL